MHANVDQSLHQQRIQSRIEQIQSRWAGTAAAPRVVIASDLDDPLVPQAARNHARAQHDAGAVGPVRGFVHRATIYLLTSQLGDEIDAATTLLHEAVGHWGLRQVHGDALDDMLALVAQRNPHTVHLKAQAYGLDPERRDHLLEAAEELLAEIAEEDRDPSLSERMEASCRAILRRALPDVRDEPFSRAELLTNFIAPARHWLMRREQRRAQAVEDAPSQGAAPPEAPASTHDWLTGSKVVDERGEPLTVWHGTTVTRVVPGRQAPGDLTAMQALKALAELHGIKEWSSVPSVFERWCDMNMAAERGVDRAMAEQARRLYTASRGQYERPIKVIGFERFRMPGGDKELGAHFGTRTQADARGTPFPFHLRLTNPIRLPDLGTWDYRSVLRELRRAGVNVTEAEYDQVFNARDNNAALRELMLAKGIDGVVYRNEAEGRGDSYIALDPAQIRPAPEQTPSTLAQRLQEIRFKRGDASESDHGRVPSVAPAAEPAKAPGEAPGEAPTKAPAAMPYQPDLLGGWADESSRLVVERVVSSRGETAQVEFGNVDSRGRRIDSTQQGLENFWAWFEHSQTVDDSGRPVLMYHGTNADVSVFQSMRESLNTGLFDTPYATRRAGIFMTPELDFASSFTKEHRPGANLMPVYVRMEEPADFRRGLSETLERQLEAAGFNTRILQHLQYDWEMFEEEFGGPHLVAALKACGYDGAIIKEADADGRSHDVYIAFDANQIKSALGNRGSWSAREADVRFHRGAPDLAKPVQPGATSPCEAESLSRAPFKAYHGTGADIGPGDQLLPSPSGTLGPGVYLTITPEHAAIYGNVLEVEVTLHNPWRIQLQHDTDAVFELDFDSPCVDAVLALPGGRELIKATAERNETPGLVQGRGPFDQGLQDLLRQMGHDGIIGTFDDGTAEVVVFDAEQVRIRGELQSEAEALAPLERQRG